MLGEIELEEGKGSHILKLYIKEPIQAYDIKLEREKHISVKLFGAI